MITLPFGINDVIWWPFCFQNKDTITLTQAFLSIYILCKSDEASCTILGYRKYKDFRTNFKTLKFQMLPWQQLLPDTPQNLISSRFSWGKHILKIW